MKYIRPLLFALLTFGALLGGGSNSRDVGISSASAADCSVVVCQMFAAQPSANPTVYLNASWPKTGGGTWCCATIIKPPTFNKVLFVNHGGGGDEFDVARQTLLTTLATVSFTVTNATWTSTYGGSTTYTLSSDPAAYVIRGNVVNVSGTQATGGTGAGYNGTGLTVLSVSAPATPPYRITVSQVSGSSPGTFTACGGGGQPTCGTLLAQTITPDSVVKAYVNALNMVVALPQGQQPLGGTSANTASYTGTVVGTQLTAQAPSVGVITLAQILNGTGLTGPPAINAQGTGRGWAGTYTISPSQTGTIGPEAMTSNGCSVSPNNQTWFNWNSDSCRDDAAMLDDLSKAFQSATPGTGAFATPYSMPAASIDCIGHSEGGGMCMRLMWEYPTDFGNFGSISMPFSLYYDSAGGGHTTLPGSKHPVWMLVGGKDPTVCVDVADNTGCGGTANKMHATIATGSPNGVLTVVSTDSGAVTPGNQITSGAQPGTYIVDQIDATHYHVFPSQTVASSTAMNMNNLYSQYIFNNSLNQSAANLQYPAFTQWTNYVNSQAEWANAYTLHGCPAGYGSQLPVSGLVPTAVVVGNLFTFDSCGGWIELNIVSEAGHDTRSITTDLGGFPPVVRFELWANAHPPS